MEKQPKEIHFVSWKKHKLEQAIPEIDAVYQDFVDEMTFETVMDFFKSFGFPAAQNIYDITRTDQMFPPITHRNTFDAITLPRKQKCPVCQEEVDCQKFTDHLDKCFKECAHPMECISKYFDEPATSVPNS